MKKLVIIFVFIFFAITANAQAIFNVTFQWDANTESDLAGYQMFIGTSSGVYTDTMDIPLSVLADPNNPEWTWEGISEGVYYWALKAYDTGAHYSTGFSNEVTRRLSSDVVPADPSQLRIKSIIEVIITVE